MGVQYESNHLKSLDEIRNIPISLATPTGPITIPLSNVAKVKRVNIPGEIAHYNISRVNDVHVNVSGRDVGSVARDIEAALGTMEFESGVTPTLRGPIATMRSGMKLLGIWPGCRWNSCLLSSDGAIPIVCGSIHYHVGGTTGAWWCAGRTLCHQYAHQYSIVDGDTDDDWCRRQ